MKRTRTIGFSVLLTILVGLAICAAYTFPLVDEDASGVGVVDLRRQWWNGTSLVSVDSDRDGRVDGRYLYPGSSGRFSPHHPPLEAWEDLNRDGRLEVHLFYRGLNVDRVEVDRDSDGVPEVSLRGEEAVLFIRDSKRVDDTARDGTSSATE